MVSPTFTPSAKPHASSMKFPNVCVSLGTGSPRRSNCAQNCSRDDLATLSRRGPQIPAARCTEGCHMDALDGRTAVVTGSGSGIGRAIATELAGAGMNVVVADIDEAAAQTVAMDIAK